MARIRPPRPACATPTERCRLLPGDYLPIVNGQYVGGDVRAAENPDLTSLDVLFVREHNYWVGQLHAEDPSLSGDQLYSMARAITTA